MIRKAALVALSMLVGLLGLVGFAVPASAHSALESSNPSEGQVLDAPPAAIELNFSQNVEVRIDETRLTAANGTVVPIAASEVDGSKVTLVLGGDLGAGSHALQWSVASADGHPISGVLRFSTLAGLATTAAPETTAPATTAAGSDTTADDTSASTTVVPSTTAAESTTSTADSGDGDDGSSATLIIIGVLVAIVVIGAVVAVAKGGTRPGKD